MKIGFDHELYTQLQSESIMKRISLFGEKLYLELGGKLFDDYHASRVLPGFHPDSKIAMLRQLKDQAELIVTINADDIEKSKVRGDLGITYDDDALRLIDAFRSIGMYVGSVVLTRWQEGQKRVNRFQNKLEAQGVRVYHHYTIEGYPYNVRHIVSEEGFGRNEYVETSRPLVLVTAPGPGSGKMAVCLSQLYQEHQRGINAGYAKFETFPVWNLPIDHPVNVAYEAATTDLDDCNCIDSYHLQYHHQSAVNYNRDIEIYPVLNTLFEYIYGPGNCPYHSPTDMGVNMVGMCITDDQACREAAEQEIIRRYYTALCLEKQGYARQSEIDKLLTLMQRLHLSDSNRPVIEKARERAEATGAPASAMQLPDGTIVTGKTTSVLGPSAALLLNALKVLGHIPKEMHLISPLALAPIQTLKCDYLSNHNPCLHSDEALIALSISAATNDAARIAMEQLPKLAGTEAHVTVILPQVDANIFKRLKINLTCDPVYQIEKLYHR